MNVFKSLPLVIDWLLTMRCNYRCSYCFHYGKHKATPPPQRPFSTLEELKTAVDNIASLNRPWYDVVFSGGEPTVHPHISDVIPLLSETLGERLNNLVILTNGSRNNVLYERLANIAKSRPITIGVSIHTDHVEMAHLLELIENLSSKVNLSFSLMFNPDKRDFVYEIYETLSDYRKKYKFGMEQYLLRESGHLDSRYTAEDLEWQKVANLRFKALAQSVKLPESSGQLSRQKIQHVYHKFHEIEDNGTIKTIENANADLKYTNGLFAFCGMYCIAHANVLSINENGLCRGMICNLDPIICNIYKENAFQKVRDELIHAVKCNKPHCGCSGNYRIPKFASEEDAKKYVEWAQKRQAELFAEYDAAHVKSTPMT